LRREIGPGPDGADDEVGKPREDVEVVVAGELDVDERDARVDYLCDVLAAGDEGSRPARLRSVRWAERARFHGAVPSRGDELEQVVSRDAEVRLDNGGRKREVDRDLLAVGSEEV